MRCLYETSTWYQIGIWYEISYYAYMSGDNTCQSAQSYNSPTFFLYFWSKIYAWTPEYFVSPYGFGRNYTIQLAKKLHVLFILYKNRGVVMVKAGMTLLTTDLLHSRDEEQLDIMPTPTWTKKSRIMCLLPHSSLIGTYSWTKGITTRRLTMI